MYSSYTLYQAEHVKTARQRQEADIHTGEVAADFGRLWHSLASRRAVRQRRFQQGARAASSVPSCQARPVVRHHS
jgi:hypothetical protein